MSPRIILSLWLGPLYPFAAAHPILFTAAALVVIWLCTMLGHLIAKLLIGLTIAGGIVISVGFLWVKDRCVTRGKEMDALKMLGGIAFAGLCYLWQQIKRPFHKLWHWMHWKP